MEKRVEKRAGDIAGADRRMARLLRLARLFETIDGHIQPMLPESARGHIRVSCLDDDCLVLAAQSPAWASRARLLADSLLTEVNRHLPKPVKRVKVVVSSFVG
jgi:hypothetical protein